MRRLLLTPCALFFAGVNTVPAADPVLNADAAIPVANASDPGFTVRTVQAPEGTVLENNFLRAVRQLNGTLADPGGEPVIDVSAPGPEGGVYHTTEIDFSTEPLLGMQGRFAIDQQFPGTSSEGFKDIFATEVITYLQLPAGTVTMGVTAGFTRTDELDDDGWRLFSALNPRDYFGVQAGEYGRTAVGIPNAEQEMAGNTTEFSITVPAAGVYPFRLVYWQTGRRSMLEWYVVKNPGLPDEDRQLIGTPESGIAAFRTVSTPAANGPWVAEVSPLPGAAGMPASHPIQAVLMDGASPVDDATIKMTHDGAAVTPQSKTRAGKKVTLTYNPNATRTGALNTVGLEFKDTAGLTATKQWQFSIVTGAQGVPAVTGQWDFNEGDLRATVGAALRYFDPATQEGTAFGTTADFGISDINGQPARVMKSPGETDRRLAYIMEHGIAPNGGGTLVNQYTLIMDIFVDTTGPGAASLLQTSSLTNQDDGDLFWQGSNFGQGVDGYRGKGTFTAGEWHRVCAAFDLAANPPVVRKYVDGIKQDDWTNGNALDTPRRALQPTALLFGDGDQDERRLMYVNAVQIRAGALTDAQMVLLGGPDAAGIPAELPVTNVAGQWDFEFGDLSATIGKPLAYLDGPGGLTELGTVFGDTSTLGVSLIGEAEAKIMSVPGELDRNIGYIMEHGIAPNGGGTRVNQFTIIFDAMVDSTGPGAAAMLQISSQANTDDGDLFWQNGNFGQGAGGYNGPSDFGAGVWHRVALAYDMAASPPQVIKVLDGVYVDTWVSGHAVDDPRRALYPTAILFGDGDQDERRKWWVNSIQIRPGALTQAQLEAFGGPQASGIPILIPGTQPEEELPEISVARNGGQIMLTWPLSVSGWVLQTSTDLSTWAPAPNVTNNTLVIDVATGDPRRYYRLFKPAVTP